MTDASLWGIELLIASWFLYFGASIGSFANVVAWRLPRGMPIGAARSHCPKCDARIRFSDNIPILSWLLLRGRCRYCHAPISPRYVIVEILFALIFVGLYFVEIRSGGTNLGRKVFHAQDALAFLRWNDTQIIWIYLYHVTALSLLATAGLMRWDGDKPPKRFVTFAILVGIIPPLFVDGLRPFDQGSEFDLGIPFENVCLGLAAAVFVEGMIAFGVVSFRALQRQASSPRPVVFTGLLIVGAFFGWQIVLFTALTAAVLGNFIGLVEWLYARFPPVLFSTLIATFFVIARWPELLDAGFFGENVGEVRPFFYWQILLAIPLLVRAILREPGNTRSRVPVTVNETPSAS